ncbi:manganese efflux pump MntP family protein [Geomicrobium sediminis]|uniref:Mn2+ efflux pump MntP n=1 Tax=Geomicrobium sediminis TaxID=1347788 RepID=A0ABS2P7P8_9BACL|nr:manganese efflux pump [Geomicrobium sediminis]MBM7631444.1 putative Mn2+ efflux pump MntP [Geomicrobium sediminis]
MFEWFSLIVMAVALGMDAFSIALVFGVGPGINRSGMWRIATSVGVFHMIMPLAGMALGAWISNFYGAGVASFVAGVILALIGIQMIFTSVSGKKEQSYQLRGIGVLFFAFIVSLDSFSVGVSLGALGAEATAVILIFGFVTMLMTLIGLSLGSLFRNRIGDYGELLAGIVLSLFGVYSAYPFILQFI